MADVSDDQNIKAEDADEDVEVVEKQPETPDQIEEVQEQEDENPEEEIVEEEPEPKVSRRAEKRIEELKIRGLIANLKQNSQPQQQPQVPDYSQQIDADPEVLQQLQQGTQKYGEQTYNHGLEQAKAIQFETRLEIDNPKVLSKYSQLDPNNSENFNPAVADAINTWYLNTVGYDTNTGMVQNPNVRYSDFVDGVMELANAAAGDKIRQSTKNIVRQSAMTGLRPDGSSAKRLNLNKDPKDMNLEELYAVTGAAGPKK